VRTYFYRFLCKLFFFESIKTEIFTYIIIHEIIYETKTKYKYIIFILIHFNHVLYENGVVMGIE